jgi:hypothetical protein
MQNSIGNLCTPNCVEKLTSNHSFHNKLGKVQSIPEFMSLSWEGNRVVGVSNGVHTENCRTELYWARGKKFRGWWGWLSSRLLPFCPLLYSPPAPTDLCQCGENNYFIHQWLYSPLLGPGLFFSFVIFFTQTVGLLGRVICPSQGRYLHTGQHKQNKRAQTSMPWVGFETTISAFERMETIHIHYPARLLWSAQNSY